MATQTAVSASGRQRGAYNVVARFRFRSSCSHPTPPRAHPPAHVVVTSLTAQQSAIRMLSERIKVCLQYVVDVRAGKLPRDHDTLRAIKAILAGMPAMDSPEFRREFLKVSSVTWEHTSTEYSVFTHTLPPSLCVLQEYNDVLLTDYLASMTKGLNALNEVSCSRAPTSLLNASRR